MSDSGSSEDQPAADAGLDARASRRERIVAARLRLRLRLRKRFLVSASESRGHRGPASLTSQGGEAQQGQHPTRLPPGQKETKKWPVLDLGEQPQLDLGTHTLIVDGAVRRPLALSLESLRGQDWEQIEERQDFHCVTGWSRLGLRFSGVRLLDLLAAADPSERACSLLIHGADGFSASLSLEDALQPSNLVVWSVDGTALERAHGGPLRLVTPGLYAWKGAKWLTRLELLEEERLGFWEARGYARRGDPFEEDRYADPAQPPPGAEIP